MNKDKVRLLICAMVCITLIIFGILFWPTLYRYDSMSDGKKTISVRINRITGTTETFGSLGWKKPFNTEDYAPPFRLQAAEVAKLIGDLFPRELYEIGRGALPNGHYVTIPDKNNFSFNASIYNGSEHTVEILMIIIEAKNKNNTTRWKRKYQAKLNGQILPFSSGVINIEPSDACGVATYIWFIDEAYSLAPKLR